jgi:hypothetical protein
MKKVVALIAVIALTGAVLTFWTFFHPPSFRVVQVAALVFTETKLSGEQTTYQAYHAHVEAYPGAAVADMHEYAERLFESQLRSIAERDGKSQVWITFNLDRVVVDGQARINTYRFIFAREGNGWRELRKN